MSNCIILNNGDTLIMASDTAVSTIINGVGERVGNNYKKIFHIKNALIFCSGKLSIVEDVIKLFENQEHIDVYKISNELKNIGIKRSKDYFNIEIIVVKMSNDEIEAYQISEYNSFNVIKLESPTKGNMCIFSAGIKSKNAIAILEKELEMSRNVKTVIKNTYKQLVCEEIGGFCEIWFISKNGIEFMSKNEIDNITNNKRDSSLLLIIGDVICGHLLAGNKLVIENEDATFSVDGNGATLTNADFTVYGNSNNTKILISPTEGFRIQKLVTGTYEDQFYADPNGNVIFTGTLSGNAAELTTGHIGGLLITSDGLYTTDLVNYLKSNGDLHWGALDISGSTATFSGNIYADNITTSVGDPVFSGDLMVGDFIYGGSMHGPHITIEMGGTGLPRIVTDNGLELIASSPTPSLVEILLQVDDPVLGNYISLGQGTSSLYINELGLDVSQCSTIKVNTTDYAMGASVPVGGVTLVFEKGLLINVIV